MGTVALTREQAEERYPEAIVLFDIQAEHIAQRDDAQFFAVNNRANERVKLHARTSDRSVRVYFDERVGVWIRYSQGVTSRPRRPPRKYATLDVQLRSCDLVAAGCGDVNCAYCYQSARQAREWGIKDEKTVTTNTFNDLIWSEFVQELMERGDW